MSKGQGFARRVTLDNLDIFAPLLGQKTKHTQEEDAANEDASTEEQGEKKETDPALKHARSLFSGTSIKTRKPRRSSGSGIKISTAKRKRTSRPKQKKPDPASIPAPATIPVPARVLLWRKQSLSRSDAQQTRSGSNPTGNVKLAKANFPIDHLKDFRNRVFSELNWNLVSGTKEEAHADFELIIRDVNYGVHTLVISHDPSREAGQHNVPTWLHWGDAGAIIRSQKVHGLVLSLYSIPTRKPAPFQIEIA